MREKNHKLYIRVLAMLFTAVISVGCFVGCDNGNEDSTGNAEELEKLGYQYEDTSAPIVAQKNTTEYRVITQKNPMQEDFNDMKVFKDLYDSTNVNVNWDCLSSGSYATQKSLIMSDKNNWPDAIYHSYFSDAEMIRYATRKVFLALDEYLDNMPYLKAFLESRPDVKSLITMPDGHFYAFPRVEEMGLMPYSNLLFMNKVWLGELVDDGSITFITKDQIKDGLDLTLDQMEQILKLFKERDMNGNGKADEIPLSFVYQNWQGNQCDLYGAFGCPDNVDHRTVLNGEVICTATTDEFFEATNFYAGWVKKGYIDKASFEYNEDTFLASGKATKQKLGAFYWWEAETVVSDPQNYITLNPLIGPNNTRLLGQSNSPEISKNLCVIFSTCKNPEILMTYFDRFYEPYTSAQISYGPIGVIYEEELDENGMLVQKPIPEGMTADEVRIKVAPMGIDILDANVWENYLNMEPRAVLRLERLEKHIKPWSMPNISRLSNPVFTLEEINYLGTYDANVYEYVIAMQTKWLLEGGVTRAEFEEFKAKLEKLNLQGVLDCYQNGYDRSIGKQVG